MTQRLILTADTARRIVESGSETVLCDLQRIGPPRHVPPVRGSWRCRFTNGGRWPIEPGEMVGITGMTDSPLSTAEAVENWRRDGLRLRVKRIGLIDDANAAWLARGVALDALPAGGTGRGAAPGVFMALVWRDPAVIDGARRFLERADWKTAEWTDPNGTVREIRRLSFVKYPGDFTVIDAAAPDEDGNVFSLLVPAPGGPSLDRIVSVDLESNTAQMACGVTASSPLAALRGTDAGKSALLTRDSVTRRWHLLVGRDLPAGGTD